MMMQSTGQSIPKQSETEDEKPENPGPSPVLPIIIEKPKNLAKQI